MNIAYIDEYFSDKSYRENVRNSYLDLWSDLFLYASNLNGNWLVSQEIFNRHLVPTAEENPVLFAKWVNDMVKISGRKIRCRALFFKYIRFLKRFRLLKKAKKEDISIAITELINAGLDEPVHAKIALNKIKAKSQFRTE